jgi:hypothetical protein
VSGLAEYAHAIDRPGEGSEPTQVEIAVGLLDIDDINGPAQSYTANVYVMLRWHDERLVHDGEGSVVKPVDEVWNPRLLILNQQKVWKSLPEVVEIAPDGTVAYHQRVWGQFSEPLTLHEFPFDKQSFHMTFVAATYRSSEVAFVDHGESRSLIMDTFSLPDWDILSWKAGPHSRVLSGGIRELSMFEFSFLARRHWGYYVLKVIVPLFLIVAMSWIVFWIDPGQSASQISVATTSMLTLIAYRFATDALVPKVSYLTRMDVFILGSTLLVFMALVQAVWTSGVAKAGRAERALAIDRVCRFVFPGLFLALCGVAFYL